MLTVIACVIVKWYQAVERSVSIVLLLSTAIVLNQLDFMLHALPLKRNKYDLIPPMLTTSLGVPCTIFVFTHRTYLLQE